MEHAEGNQVRGRAEGEAGREFARTLRVEKNPAP
jgi:hypothetical protein